MLHRRGGLPSQQGLYEGFCSHVRALGVPWNAPALPWTHSVVYRFFTRAVPCGMDLGCEWPPLGAKEPGRAKRRIDLVWLDADPILVRGARPVLALESEWQGWDSTRDIWEGKMVRDMEKLTDADSQLSVIVTARSADHEEAAIEYLTAQRNNWPGACLFFLLTPPNGGRSCTARAFGAPGELNFGPTDL